MRRDTISYAFIRGGGLVTGMAIWDWSIGNGLLDSWEIAWLWAAGTVLSVIGRSFLSSERRTP